MARQLPLQIDIDRQRDLPIYLQICERFKRAIAAGRLKPGDRVPAQRGLALQLNTARGTVELAYTILVNEGYLQMRGAAGTIVSPALAQVTSRAGVRLALQSTVPPQLPVSQKCIRQSLSAPGPSPRPLQPGLPALDAFPGKVWKRIVTRRLHDEGTGLLGYPDPAGYAPLREYIATYLSLSRGVACAPEQVFITSGYRATLELMLRSLSKQNDRVWFEDPGYLLARQFLEHFGVKLVPVPVDEQGIDVACGRQLAGDARFAIVTPSHQSPLGHTLSLARRLALIDWAKDAKSWIIEDDYDSEFRYVGRPLPPLKSLDTHDCVIYCGTFSKVMFPGLRLAYAVVPERAVARVGQVARSMNAGAPTLIQSSVADFIAEGHFGRHLKRMRPLYEFRRALIASAFRTIFGEGMTIQLPPGGIQLSVQFAEAAKGPVNDSAVANLARDRGMGVMPLSIWHTNVHATNTPRGLVLGFANITQAEEALAHARTLVQCLDASWKAPLGSH
ncbi:PLP-dependent aminotransferase family protein [Caballeronia sp. LZ043]|uniref:MocR-like pyridoxine biosynthesis transcription factor PdxR n=1 Tax=Caballeronia sp. LZ043 TaxID=3038569 RepID=UPI00285ED080|nr:PLP-dependent aminotransferase family protein [Caballeronia sp. LZ043]MDR5823626.1 PLP-dependent aminotransferase family protein [Caballeronia sp. LZ043]